MQWRIVHASGYKAIQVLWSLGENSLRCVLGWKGCKDARSCSSQLRRAKLIEPINRILYLRVQRFNQGLTVVFPALLEEGRYCNGGRVSCQIFMRKNGSRGNMALRGDYQVPERFGLHALKLLADAFRPGGFSPHKHRHIRSQLQAQFAKLVEAQARLPKVIQSYQGGSGITAAAADTAAHRQSLDQFDARAFATTGGLLQKQGRPVNEVVMRRDAGQFGSNSDLRVRRNLKRQLIAMVKQLKQRLQGVITVRPSSGNVQEKVQLGRGWKCQGIHSSSCQCLIASTRRTSSRLAMILWGSMAPFASS